MGLIAALSFFNDGDTIEFFAGAGVELDRPHFLSLYPLHLAVLGSNGKTEESLLQLGVSPESLGPHSVRPIHLALGSSHTAPVSFSRLLDYGADATALDANGCGSFHYLVSGPAQDSVKLMQRLVELQVSPLATDHRGQSVLEIAARSSALAFVETFASQYDSTQVERALSAAHRSVEIQEEWGQRLASVAEKEPCERTVKLIRMTAPNLSRKQAIEEATLYTKKALEKGVFPAELARAHRICEILRNRVGTG